MAKIKFVVNKNINKNTILVLVLISFALFAYFAVNTVLKTIETKDYQKIDAKITDITYHIYAQNDNNTYHYAKLSYTYNNESYENEQRLAIVFNKKPGNTMRIYVDPSNPKNVRNNFNYRLNIILTIFFLIWNIAAITAYIKKKKGE